MIDPQLAAFILGGISWWALSAAYQSSRKSKELRLRPTGPRKYGLAFDEIRHHASGKYLVTNPDPPKNPGPTPRSADD